MLRHWNTLKRWLPQLITLALAFLVLWITGIGCPLQKVFGISCPGCGLTRAWLQVFRGQFSEALHYHPLFWLAPLVLLDWMADNAAAPPTGEPRNTRWSWSRLRPWFRISAALLFLLVYVYRIFTHSDVLEFQPQNGLLWRFAETVRRLFY